MKRELVVVTGGTGFVAGHCIVRLLRAGYRVRTTVRNLARAGYVREIVDAAGLDGSAVQVVEADLTADDGWPAAMRAATYVLHVASPFPPGAPQDENDLIVPARDGTLRVLRAAREAGVRRVVVTSSFAAVGYGLPGPMRPVTEADWTNPQAPGVGAYPRSKTLAERAAWAYAAEHPGIEVAVVNPVAIFGPVLGPDLSSSAYLVQQAVSGAIPRLPKGSLNIVDVRDVADLLERAMTDPAAAGERFLASSGEPMALPDLARLLRSRLGEAGSRVPKRTIPTWLLRTLAALVPSLREAAARTAQAWPVDATKARRVLGWQPRDREEAVLAMARSLIDAGLVRPPDPMTPRGTPRR